MTAVTRGCVDEGSRGHAVFTPLALRCFLQHRRPKHHPHATPRTSLADPSAASAHTSHHADTHIKMLYWESILPGQWKTSVNTFHSFLSVRASVHADGLTHLPRLILSQVRMLTWSWQAKMTEAKTSFGEFWY